MALGSLFHSVGAATAKLHSREHLFNLDEEIDGRLSRVGSLRLTREERYGGWLYGFISKEVVFEQYTVMNGEPV